MRRLALALLVAACDAGDDHDASPIASASGSPATFDPVPSPGDYECDDERVLTWVDDDGALMMWPPDVSARYAYPDRFESVEAECAVVDGEPGCRIACADDDVLSLVVFYLCGGLLEHPRLEVPLDGELVFDGC